MKKLIWLTLLLSSVTLFSGCWLTSLIAGAAEVSKAQKERNQDELYNDLSDSKKREVLKKICETYTPKNSVLVYGTITGFHPDFMAYIQTDRTKPAHHLEFIGDSSFTFKPCVPGGTYHAYFRQRTEYSSFTGTRQYLYGFGLQGTTAYDFTTPTKPGLYFYGDFFNTYDYSFRRTYKNPTGKYPKQEKDLASQEIKALKYALVLYKDTSWEPVINKRLEELGGKK